MLSPATQRRRCGCCAHLPATPPEDSAPIWPEDVARAFGVVQCVESGQGSIATLPMQNSFAWLILLARAETG